VPRANTGAAQPACHTGERQEHQFPTPSSAYRKTSRRFTRWRSIDGRKSINSDTAKTAYGRKLHGYLDILENKTYRAHLGIPNFIHPDRHDERLAPARDAQLLPLAQRAEVRAAFLV